MKVLRITLAALMAAFVFTAFLGCEEEVTEPPLSQADWTAEGWEAWTAGDFDDAIRYFGNAIKIDDNYMPAYNGLGWTYMRLQDTESSVIYFEDGILYGAGYPNTDADKRALYVGLAYALEASDEFLGSVTAGETYLAMDPNGVWIHPHDTRLTAYDAYIILAVDYFARGNSVKCVAMVNNMRLVIGEPGGYSFTTWSALAGEIERLVDLDPS
jgi:tetratricopeptide (TPR) repeat protein